MDDVLRLVVSAVALVFGLRHCVHINLLPDPSIGWPEKPSDGASVMAAAVLFAAVCMLEQAAHALLGILLHGHPLVIELGDRWPRARTALARHAMDIIALSYAGFLGYRMYSSLDPNWTTCVTSGRGVVTPPGCIPASAHDRLYVYVPLYQWLCVVQLAYQTKNLFDSVRHADGAEFVGHHIVCIVSALGCLHTRGWLHLYGIFYFGLSEVSTALLAALSTFDGAHGVVELGRYFPVTKLVLGLAFAAGFVVARAAVWPYLAFRGVFQDCREVLRDGTAHSPLIVCAYLTMLFALTVLQLVWLAEIARRAPAELRAGLTFAFGRDKPKGKAKAKGKAK